MYEEEDSLPRRKAPPRWKDPVPMKAVPLTARNKEVEEVQRENERIKREREALMQQCEQDRANMKEEILR